MMKLMTPGPTQIRENVRIARSLETTNPDLDLNFYDEYKKTCELLSHLMHTKNTSYILSGEGILGLEAACASLTERGDRVLVLDNGIFGRGFADFVTLYGGTPVLLSSDYQEELSITQIEEFLRKDHAFKYATLVHCDTPSGMLNNIQAICPLLKKYGILTVVDSVAGAFGNEVNVDQSQIDILCLGSQKALSAPIGLTMLTISEAAFVSMKRRKSPIASFYANILTFENYYKDKWFPYSMPISDIYGLRTALENVAADPDILDRHARCAKRTRDFITGLGLSLYNRSGYSNTVTVFKVPKGLKSCDILNRMQEVHGIMIAGSFDILAGEVLRIGHMGENARDEDITQTLDALKETLETLNK
ncbi:MAG: alanine--glyoxylate aminotransferase family protein [Acetivibrio sp.]